MPLRALLPYSLSQSITRSTSEFLFTKNISTGKRTITFLSFPGSSITGSLYLFQIERNRQLGMNHGGSISIISNGIHGKTSHSLFRRDRCSLYRLIGLKTNQFGLFQKPCKQKCLSCFEYISKGDTEL